MNIKQFLQMIAGKGGVVRVLTLAADKSNPKEFQIKPDDYDAESIQERFTTLSQEEQQNVLFQVGAVEPNSKKPAHCNVIWADVDLYKYPDGVEQVNRLLRQLPAPTIIINSGRGRHIYWQLKAPVGPKEAQHKAKSLQWLLGADAAHAPNKLLRIPYTLNYKPKEYEGGKPCEIIEYNPDNIYDINELPGDEVLNRVGYSLMQKIILGPESNTIDRSEFDFAIAAGLFNQGFTEDEVLYLMNAYPCSGKGDDPETANKQNYVARTVTNALQRVKITGVQIVNSNKKPVIWQGKTLRQILQDEKPDYIIDNFLPAAGIAMLAAPPKARKSWAVMQMAYAVATGTKWLDFNVSVPRKVLYVQAELPNWMVAERVTQLFGNEDIPNMKFYHVPAANLTEEEHLDGLIEQVNEENAELVIIDPIANFWQGDENSSSSVNALFDNIAKIQSLGCAVVMVHHSRKTDQNERLSPQHQRGSNVFFARPDVVMTLSPMFVPGGQSYTWADFALRAAAPKEPLKLYTTDEGGFTVEQPTLGESNSPVRLRMLELSKRRSNRDVPPWEDSNVMTYGD